MNYGNQQSDDDSSSSEEEVDASNNNIGSTSNIGLNRFLAPSIHLEVGRNNTHLNYKAFSAVDEEQSNMQDDAQSNANLKMDDESQQSRYLNKKYMM